MSATAEATILTTPSQVMVDKVVSVPRTAVVRAIGRCDLDQLAAIDDALRVWLEVEPHGPTLTSRGQRQPT